MEVNFNNTQNVTYDATGNERVEEKTTTNSAFANDLEEAQTESTSNTKQTNKEKEEELTLKEAQEKTSKLVDDIMSLFRTGLTVEEFKEMQRLLDEIKKKVDKLEPPLRTKDIEEIDEMFKKLEKMILEFQKKIKGEAIIELEDSASNIKNKKDLNQNESKNEDKNSADIAGFLKRIEKAQDAIDDLKQNKIASSGKTMEELELLQKLKQVGI